ncbi:MAG: tripartite tricarboxylate transporter substrate binding protein [Betaproteobacteria bacterium]|nr:tripartite tricarboxylate transporter substrate binding protein [Betaproteobacteria bacterium]
MRFRATPLILLATTVYACATANALAQTYPTGPVRFVAASAAGGTSDIVARLLAQKLSEDLKQQFLVDNRAGASGIIGTGLVAKAPPDGYTLLLIQPSLTINPSMFAKVPYDARRDLAPVSIVVDVPQIISVHPSLPAKSVPQLIALAKKQPGQITIGSPGIGTHPQLTAELFQMRAVIKFQNVVYKGITPALTALASGEVAVLLSAVPSAMPFIKGGRIVPLAVTSAQRIAFLPDVPTLAQTALPDFESSQWFGVLAPGGTPRPIIDTLYKAISRATQDAQTRDKLTGLGMTIVGSTPEQFEKVIREETDNWAKVIKAADIKPQ